MAEKSEFFSSFEGNPEEGSSTIGTLRWPSEPRYVAEIAVVLGLILAAAWTPQGTLNEFFRITAAACIVAFAITGKWSPSEMGLTRPLAGALSIMISGVLLCAVIALAGVMLRFAGAGHALA